MILTHCKIDDSDAAVLQGIAYCGSRSSAHVLKITDTERGPVSHVSVSGQHSALVIIRRQDNHFIGMLKDIPVDGFVFFLPFCSLCLTWNGKGQDDIGMMLPEPYCLYGCKRIESEGAAAEKTPVTFSVRSRYAVIKILGNTVDFTGRQMPVTGEKRSRSYAVFRKKMIIHRISPF